MRGRLRFEIANHYAAPILKNDVGCGSARKNFTEEAISLTHGPNNNTDLNLSQAAAMSSSDESGDVTDSRTRSMSAPSAFSFVSIFS